MIKIKRIYKVPSYHEVVIKILFLLLAIKLGFSYLNVELNWWLRDFTPNFEKYNFLALPENFSELIEYIIIPLMLVYILLNINKLGGLAFTLLGTLTLFFFNIITSYFNEIDLLSSLKYSLKIASPIYFLTVLVIYIKSTGNTLNSLMKTMIIYCFLLTFIGLIFFDPSFNRGEFRLPVFFSGIHTQNYILACLFIVLAIKLQDSYWKMTVFLFASFLFLVLGYNVRTAIVFYFIVIAVFLYIKSDFFKYLIYKILVVIPFVFVFFIGFFLNFDWNSFSSGRLSMYEEKLKMISNFNLREWLFGLGFESDLIRTEDWWFAEKGSHNDYLTYLVENGLPYVFVFILTILSILLVKRKASLILWAMILGYLSTSMLSNGFAVRPLASYIFFLVFAYILTLNSNWVKQNE